MVIFNSYVKLPEGKFGRSLFHPFPLFPRCFRHSESRFDSDDNLGPHVEIRCAVEETANELERLVGEKMETSFTTISGRDFT